MLKAFGKNTIYPLHKSAAAMIALFAMTNMSVSRCFLVRSTLGSLMSPNARNTTSLLQAPEFI